MWKSLSLLALLCAAPVAAQEVGRTALPAEIAAWDLDVRPDGHGLPDGTGSVAEGEVLYYDHCAQCHGDFGEGLGRYPALAGGALTGPEVVKSVGSFWPFLSTSVDYIRRAMPPADTHTLSAADSYALTAYVLYLNDLVGSDFTLSRDNFATITLPNAAGFRPDDRGAVEIGIFSQPPCMRDCKDSVAVTGRAADLGLDR